MRPPESLRVLFLFLCANKNKEDDLAIVSKFVIFAALLTNRFLLC